jgi:uncharacterized protein Yka (UPF0111/DUF47 family)
MRFNLLDFLLPRETKFYDLFIEHSGRLVAAGKRLRELALALESASEADRRDVLKAGVMAIKEIEREADKIEGRINEALDESFITPFDREDIHLVASFVDNSIDSVKALVNKVETYGVLRFPPRSVEFCDVIVECAQLLSEAFALMEKRSPASGQAKAVREAERRADVLFSIAIGDLFNDGKDPIEVIKAKEVYEGLEEIVNRIDSAAKLLRRVIIKQG